MRRGLVLEGGAMRGIFTAGVMDVMMENGICYDGAIGVSAGAAFGCNYKSKQIGRVIRYNKRFCSDRRFSGLGCLIRTGDIFSKDFAYGEVPLKLDPFDFDTYEKNPMEFHVVCTDVETGRAVYHEYMGMADHGFDWIRASASMPVVSRIVDIDGRLLLDGGISDSIPVRYFQSISYDRNVIVLTRPRDYRKGSNKLMPIIRRMYRKYPDFVRTMEERHLVYNETLEYIEEQERAGNVYVISPEAPLEIGKVEKDPDKLEEIYRIGRKAGLKHVEEIKEFLDK